jgi:Uma2 family endonuclease
MMLTPQVCRRREAMVTRTFTLGPEFDLFEDDTEETLVGSSFHQAAITALDNGLNFCGPGRGLPWFVGNQLRLILPREGGKPTAQPSPDIIVHPTLGNSGRSSLDVVVEGPPSLAIEVVSPATALGRDLNVTEPVGKPQLYAAAGIREYLAFDPLAEFIREQVRAWLLGPQGISIWLPDANGRWVSTSLGVSFAVQGALLRIYDQDGQLVPVYREAISTLTLREQQLTERDREIALRDQQLTQRDREIAALQAELRRLRGL